MLFRILIFLCSVSALQAQGPNYRLDLEKAPDTLKVDKLNIAGESVFHQGDVLLIYPNKIEHVYKGSIVETYHKTHDSVSGWLVEDSSEPTRVYKMEWFTNHQGGRAMTFSNDTGLTIFYGQYISGKFDSR